MTDTAAAVIVPAPDFGAELAFWQGQGFRLEAIWPADDPAVAVVSRGAMTLRLEREATGAPAVHLAGEGAAQVSPGGTRVRFGPMVPALSMPKVQHGFGVRRLADGAPWVIGRAGMQYRDLVPDRLGGAIVASHIRIPDGGPVPDMVHYHTVGFQLIFCHKGWVDLVYEDQGPPFRLDAGGCVVQPPEIRHRVLCASDEIEVVEIGVPAVHVTTIDHGMRLPNDRLARDRLFQGQRFVWQKADAAVWTPARQAGFVSRDTTIAENTGDVAGVRVLRFDGGPTAPFRHGGEIYFTFVRAGMCVLRTSGEDHTLTAADAVVLPPGQDAQYQLCSDDLELLEVTLPGRPSFVQTAPGKPYSGFR
ncbi:MAG: cupin [Pseudomonadota bacterium]